MRNNSGGHKKLGQKKRIGNFSRKNRKRYPIVTPLVTLSKSVPKGILKSFIYEPKENHPDLYNIIFFDSISIPLRTLIQKELENLKGVKVSLILQVEMEKGDDITATDKPYFRSGPMTVTTSHEIGDGIRAAHSQIHRNIDKWIENGSNRHINHITRFYVDVAAYQPMRGKSYLDLPNNLKKKKAIINVKNEDD